MSHGVITRKRIQEIAEELVLRYTKDGKPVFGSMQLVDLLGHLYRKCLGVQELEPCVRGLEPTVGNAILCRKDRVERCNDELNLVYKDWPSILEKNKDAYGTFTNYPKKLYYMSTPVFTAAQWVNFITLMHKLLESEQVRVSRLSEIRRVEGGTESEEK